MKVMGSIRKTVIFRPFPLSPMARLSKLFAGLNQQIGAKNWAFYPLQTSEWVPKLSLGNTLRDSLNLAKKALPGP